jgi:hypothetical protein
MRAHVLALALGGLLVVALPSLARAHAVVTHTSLEDAPIVADRPTEVTLHFNSAIETSHVTVGLVDAGGKVRALSLAPGTREPGVLVVTLPALASGKYALRYKVLAADGHVTESVLRFEVKP